MKKMFLTAVLLCFVTTISHALPYTDPSNTFRPGDFPGEIKNDTFSIPVLSGDLIVVYPAAADSILPAMKAVLKSKIMLDIPFIRADRVSEDDLAAANAIIVGNIANNPRALELYKRRHAFADSYFPGGEGIIIHPAASLWNPEKRCIVVGMSRDEDIGHAFETFCDLLGNNAADIGPLHLLETSLKFPEPPESVSGTLDTAFGNAETAMMPYWSIANWGLLYFLSGDSKWAEHFRDGMLLCHRRAEQHGRWVTESWTNLYFNHWKLVYAWELIDDDPFFTVEDRRLIEETLWGFTSFVRWLPNLDEENAPRFEPRQNHTTFLALSLYYAHRYYTEKFGVAGLEPMMEKVRRCFDHGQAHSYRPNDDAGNYLYLAPLHMMTYDLAEGRDGYFSSGRFRTLADLVVATIDNRRDPVSFGDVGGFSHRGPGSRRGRGLQFLGLGAWRYQDSQYKWLYNWGARDRVISLDTMSEEEPKEENPIKMHFGADRVFSVEDMYTGVYEVPLEEEVPERYLGVFPVLLDDAACRFAARRCERNEWLPREGEQYFDKLSYRWNFSPDSEYLLLDGLSFMSHGHLDGNTVSRLTWKDRIWLFDLDYIKHTPRYHNGVTVTRDGVQEDPPPLTVLDCAADFSKYGFTRTTVRDYNGADWERNVVWRKGRYFLFLDRLTALKNGDYRLKARWRSRGDVDLDDNTLSVRQSDAMFFIKSADSAMKSIAEEPDGSRSRWNYPYGDGATTVMTAAKEKAMTANESFLFSSLMYATEEREEMPRELYRLEDSLFAVGNPETSDLIGLDPAFLEREGVYTDCDCFIKDSRSVWLLNATYVRFGEVFLEAPGRVHLEINYRKHEGRMIVPEQSTGRFEIKNISMRKLRDWKEARNNRGTQDTDAHSMEFTFSFRGGLWKNRLPFMDLKLDAEPVVTDTPRRTESPFGIERLDQRECPARITASAVSGSSLFCGDSNGTIHRIGGGRFEQLCTLPSGASITCICASDLDGDNKPEIIAGDSAEQLYCYSADGSLRWQHKLTKYYGTDAVPVEIIAADIDHSGKKTVLVSTNGWKLYAIEPSGTIRWKAFTYYHPQTSIAVGADSAGENYIAVGTEYHTPLNVLSPADGAVRWHVWEEMGSEYLVTTDYCGIHLTDIVTIPACGTKKAAIVFGTKYNRVYSLNPTGGATQWQANTGGEVTSMACLDSGSTGEKLFLIGTEEGDCILLGENGATISRTSFGASVSDIAVLAAPDGISSYAAVGGSDGVVRILDHALSVKGVYRVADEGPVRIHAISSDSGTYSFFAVSGDTVHRLSFAPLPLKKSRHY